MPLRTCTPDHWAAAVLRDPLALLADHAHLERKAAGNALELLSRFPQRDPPEHWATTLTAIARDEVEHLGAVTRLLYRRGGQLFQRHANPYAAALRRQVRLGTPGELVDRLLISALIEARSCERFAVLGRCCEDADLSKLYRGLWASERGHYHVFLQLAEQISTGQHIQPRWDSLLEIESQILTDQSPGPRIHSGV